MPMIIQLSITQAILPCTCYIPSIYKTLAATPTAMICKRSDHCVPKTPMPRGMAKPVYIIAYAQCRKYDESHETHTNFGQSQQP